MRYRVLSKGKAKHLSIPEKPAEKTASLKAADLDNPYGQVFGTQSCHSLYCRNLIVRCIT